MLFLFYFLVILGKRSVRFLTVVDTSSYQQINPYTAIFKPSNPLNKQNSNRLVTHNNTIRNLGLIYRKNDFELKSVNVSSVYGFLALTKMQRKDLLERFPFSFHGEQAYIDGENLDQPTNQIDQTKQSEQKENMTSTNSAAGVYIKNLESVLDGQSLFTFILKDLFCKINYKYKHAEYIFVVEQSELRDCTENIAKACNNLNLNLFAIIPKSLAILLKNITDVPPSDKDIFTVVTTDKMETMLDLYQIDVSSESKVNGKKEELRPVIKHLHSSLIPEICDNSINEIYKKYTVEVTRDRFKEDLKRLGETSDFKDELDLVAWPFDQNNILKKYFFDYSELSREIPEQLGIYLKWIEENSSSKENYAEEKEKMQKYHILSIDIQNKEKKSCFNLNEVEIDLKELALRVFSFIKKQSVRQIEKSYLEKVVEIINDKSIDFQNITDHMIVLGNGSFLQFPSITKELFEHIKFDPRSFDRNWAKGGNSLLLFDIQDDRPVYFTDKKALSRSKYGKSETFEAVKDEIAVRNEGFRLSKKFKKPVDIGKIRWQKYRGLHEIKRKIENTEFVSLENVTYFSETFAPTDFLYETLPKSLERLRKILKRCQIEMEKDAELAEILKLHFDETKSWYDEKVTDAADKDTLEFDLFIKIDKMERNLKGELSANLKSLELRRQFLKAKKEQEEKIKREQEEMRLKREQEELRLKELKQKDPNTLTEEEIKELLEEIAPEEPKKEEFVDQPIPVDPSIFESADDLIREKEKKENAEIERIQSKLAEDLQKDPPPKSGRIQRLLDSLLSRKQKKDAGLTKEQFKRKALELYEKASKKYNQNMPHLKKTFVDPEKRNEMDSLNEKNQMSHMDQTNGSKSKWETLHSKLTDSVKNIPQTPQDRTHKYHYLRNEYNELTDEHYSSTSEIDEEFIEMDSGEKEEL